MAAPSTPQRPARGLPAEEALEHWSDAEAYAAMRQLWQHRPTYPQMMVFPSPTDPRELEYRRRRRPLEEQFLERLRLRELLATAVPKDADPIAPRTLVDPEVLSHATLIFEDDRIAGPHGAALYFVEIFEPPGVPLNVRIIPDWYWEQHEPVQISASPSAPDADMPRNQPSFRQEADYRRVWINGAEFRLTLMQATVVKLLHQAYLENNEWRSGKRVLGQAGSKSMQMFHVFRFHKTPHWSLLIESDGRGLYRLNIRE